MTTQLPSRIEGATLPTTIITWREDNTPLNLASYTGWTVEARALSASTPLTGGWPKTTGITATSLGVVTIVWSAGDIGSLTADGDATYLLELSGTLGSGIRKHQFQIVIEPENT